MSDTPCLNENHGDELLQKFCVGCLHEHIALLEKANETMRVGLDKLARFGNEPYLGNSKGNDIAIDALRAAGYEVGV